MTTQNTTVTTPVGRIVQGSLYKPRTVDFDGKPLVVKTGPNMGQPRVDYFIALAIPKTPGATSWAQEQWGTPIYQVGAAAFPQAIQRPDFAWKIEDGDSTIPNKKGRVNAQSEGYPGNWILKISGGFAPKIYAMENGQLIPVLQEDFIKPGYFAQVWLDASGNNNANNPGIYLNNKGVCFRGYGPEINFGPDPSEAGFGAAPLPAGASAMPLPGTNLPPNPSPAAVPNPIGVLSAALPSPIAVAGPVLPNPSFLNGPGVATAGEAATRSVIPPPPTVAATASPSRMTAKAGGATREQFIANGWTDAALIANGYMLA